MSRFTIVGIGELLWDVFSSHKQLGGAPANFAYISSLLGEDGTVASRIGTDSLGDEVLDRLVALGLDHSNIQRDPRHATGTVLVEVHEGGQPRFEITKDVAWDFLEWTPRLGALAQRADAICFGSLAQRGLGSRETIQRFIESSRAGAVRVFDVNLREAFFSSEVLIRSASAASMLKLNHEELPVVMRTLGGPALDELRSAQWLCRSFGLQLVCVTRGCAGSLLVTKDAHAEHRGCNVTVVDTVGAGDAFTAALVHHFLHGSTLEKMSEAANLMGSWVASQRGGTPPKNVQEILRMQA